MDNHHRSIDPLTTDKVQTYSTKIQDILNQYCKITIQAQKAQGQAEPADQLAFDPQRHQYIWFCSGWDGKRRIQHISMYLKIKDQKIWVEEDNTDLGLVDALLEAGVPKDDIILGFQHPSKRTLTEFAVA